MLRCQINCLKRSCEASIITSERKSFRGIINSLDRMVYADNDPNQLADKANEMLDDLSGYRSTLTDGMSI